MLSTTLKRIYLQVEATTLEYLLHKSKGSSSGPPRAGTAHQQHPTGPPIMTPGANLNDGGAVGRTPGTRPNISAAQQPSSASAPAEAADFSGLRMGGSVNPTSAADRLRTKRKRSDGAGAEDDYSDDDLAGGDSAGGSGAAGAAVAASKLRHRQTGEVAKSAGGLHAALSPLDETQAEECNDELHNHNDDDNNDDDDDDDNDSLAEDLAEEMGSQSGEEGAAGSDDGASDGYVDDAVAVAGYESLYGLPEISDADVGGSAGGSDSDEDRSQGVDNLDLEDDSEVDMDLNGHGGAVGGIQARVGAAGGHVNA